MSEPSTDDRSKVTFRLPEELRRRFKVAIARDGRSQEEVLNGMVQAWTERQEKEHAE